MPRSANITDWFSLAALTLLWGSSFALNEIALSALTPAEMVAARVLIGAIVVYGFMRASGISLPSSTRDWIPMAAMALLGNVLPFELVAWGQQFVDSSTAAVIMAATPLFVLTLAHYFVPGARLTALRLLGFVVGLLGVVFVIGPGAFSGIRGNVTLFGAIAILLASLSYSINSIYARRLGASNPVQLAAGMLIAASLLAMPRATISVPEFQFPGAGAAIAVLILGLLSTGFATILYFRIIQGPGPTFLSLVNYLVPAWAVLLGVVFLGESLSAISKLGLALILAGIAVSELRFDALARFRRMYARPELRRTLTEDA